MSALFNSRCCSLCARECERRQLQLLIGETTFSLMAAVVEVFARARDNWKGLLMNGTGETTNSPAKTPRRSVRIAANFLWSSCVCLLSKPASLFIIF